MAQLICPLSRAAKRHPHHPAMQSGQQLISYQALERQVQSTALEILEYGVQPGDHLVIISRDQLLIARLLFASLRLGCVTIPVNPALPPTQQQNLVRRADARWLYADHIDFELPAECRRLTSPDLDLATEMQDGEITIDATSPISGIFTSGTTGQPKLALHSYANHYFSAQGSAQQIPVQPGDGWALTLPLYHIAGIATVFRTIIAGAMLVVPNTKDLREVIDNPRVTHLSAINTQLLRLQHQDIALDSGSLRHLLLGGSDFAKPLLRWLSTFSIKSHMSYGLTEMSSQVMTGPVNDQSRISTLLPYRQLRLSDSGEILLRGETLWLGYYQQGEIHRHLDSDGWFHSRDLGEQDSRGGLRILGRLDNQFISGGENIQPEAIEAIIHSFRGIDECYVVPITDEEYGQRPVCFLRPLPVDQGEALAAFLKPRLAVYQQPLRYFELLPEHNSGGLKVSRQQLTELAAQQGNS